MHADFELLTVQAFSHAGRGGNAAGVVLAADALSHDDKQRIAAAAGFSETAFVLRSNRASVRLEFFTPNRQIADCGHATVAAFSELRARGLIADGDASKEILDGIRAIRVAPDAIYMQQAAPVFSPPLGASDSADWLAALQPDSRIRPAAALQIGSTGGRFLLLPLADVAGLRALQPDMNRVEQLSNQHDVIGVYAFVSRAADPAVTTVTRDPRVAALSRMFAPRFGIPEESATGIAAGALGLWLLREELVPVEGCWLAQGDVMNPASPSRLHVIPAAEAPLHLPPWVGGSAHRQLNTATAR